MRYILAAWLCTLCLASPLHAQTFDGRKGYIFDQPYVTRITEAAAAALVPLPDAGDAFWKLYEAKRPPQPLPTGVKQQRGALVFELPGKPRLSLKSYVYTGKDDAGDSQRFAYVSDLGRYHLAVVEFDHDRPCFLLVDKSTLKLYFVDYAQP